MSLLPKMWQNKNSFKNKKSCSDKSMNIAEAICTVLLKARNVIIILVINNVPETDKNTLFIQLLLL